MTASGTTCGAGETPEYRFYYLNSAGQYFVIRDWSTTPTANWDTTGLPSGSYGGYVLVRAVGGNGSTSSAYFSSAYSIGSVCNTTNSFNFSPTSPQPSGTPISLTATATCTGSGVPEFHYSYYAASGALVDINAGFSTAPVTWTTTGLSGPQTLLVYTRAVGNTSVRESYMYGGYTLGTAATTCTTVSIGAAPSAPQPAGTTITLSGSSTGCNTPQYQFSYRLYGTGPWLLIRDWGSATVGWDTTGLASGTYELLIRARGGTSGIGDSYSEITYAIGNTCTGAAVSASPTSPQGQGAQITLTGTSTCSSGTPEYAFYYQKSSDPTPVLIRGYGAATVNWDTTLISPAVYTLTVTARAVGNTSNYDSLGVASFTVAGAQIAKVSAGFGYHTCGVVNNGTAACWGENPHGELGNSTTSPSSSLPVTVTGLNTVSAVAVGESHSCALLTDNTVRCWGDGSFGQLGNGGTAASSSPVTVTGISDATAISAGMNHTCVLRTGGAVSCWGYNPQGQIGDPTGASFPSAKTPVAVTGISGASAIALGGFHSCALVGGSVSCWGDNSSGQLGDGAAEQRSSSPVAVSGLSGVTSLSGGELSTCAVVGGGVKCWGDNTYGQLGNGSKTQANTPATVSGLTTAVQVSAGFPMSCARLSGGSVSCWGYNNEGELGNGGSTESLTPSAVSNITAATALSTGGTQSCVILSAGGAQCWGYNGLGQLGNGSAADAHTPVNVTYP